MKNRSYLCIDLKSFYASVECVDRGLDPFKVNLVVADPARGPGSICLAVSPAMKALGVPGRCRVFEIPKRISYLMARPRMQRYLDKSTEIFGIYLRYVAPDDIYVYSVDECFIDATDYLRFYQKTEKEFADMLRDAVFRQTGICATAGIGTNLFLAKVALDVVAKHTPDHIGVLDESSFRETVWHHRPITDIWNVGPGIASRLERYGVYDLYGVTQLPEATLFRAFGASARYLIDHANGVEPCTMAEIKSYVQKTTSLSSSQILFSNYNYEDAHVILREMVDQMVLELVKKSVVTGSVSLFIGYADRELPHAGKSRKLHEKTASYRTLSAVFDELYGEAVSRTDPIRRIGISMGELIPEADKPLTLFSDDAEEKRERSLLQSIVSLRERYGKNAVVRARDFVPCATLRARNRMIGGHNES
ncbi:MAG: DNA repair protein [Ruminococcus sp.]|nr:DNA repair protein [Candidatus Apopatosoma intestinale]